MKLSFEEWLKQVDKHISAKIGLGYQDLPDCCYRDWYDDGVTAKSAAARALRNAGGDF